jgi:hypothetical protein
MVGTEVAIPTMMARLPLRDIQVRPFEYAEYQRQVAQAAARGKRAHMRVPGEEALQHLLPMCDLGCCQDACVDDQERMFIVAATESNDFYALEQLPWDFEEWLWRWVRDDDIM